MHTHTDKQTQTHKYTNVDRHVHSLAHDPIHEVNTLSLEVKIQKKSYFSS